MKNIIKILSLLSLIMLLTFSCEKDEDTDTVTTTEQNNDIVESLGKFTCEIDGESYEMHVTNDMTVIAGSAANIEHYSLDPLATRATYVASTDNFDSGEHAGIFIGPFIYTETLDVDDELFKSFFPVGNYNYTDGVQNGVNVWINIDGVEWTSDKGTEDQTGSTFNISSVTEINNFGTLYLQVEATFSCKIYDYDGNEKVITNGTFIGKFGNIS